jgi:hypothetical protein
MSPLNEKLANLLEYFGGATTGYGLSRLRAADTLADPLVYYLDMTPLAMYSGSVDRAGLPEAAYAPGLRVPVLILNWALGNLEFHRRTGAPAPLAACRRTVQWLLDSQQPDGSWLHPLAKPAFGLKPPFRSAMIQGLALSFLLRMGRILSDPGLTDAARRGFEPFNRAVADGGVTTYHSDGPFFEEYPCTPPCHVLNGSVFALFGLWDLVRFTASTEARQQWADGLHTLKAWLPKYDLGYWSLYHLPDSPPNPSTPKYHELHIDQLRALHELTGDKIFADYVERWDAYRMRRTNVLRTLPAKIRWVLSSR